MTELRKFIGIQILMGLNRRDDECDHWSSDELLTTDAIRRTMSRDRYHIIKRFLHFCDEISR